MTGVRVQGMVHIDYLASARAHADPWLAMEHTTEGEYYMRDAIGWWRVELPSWGLVPAPDFVPSGVLP